MKDSHARFPQDERGPTPEQSTERNAQEPTRSLRLISNPEVDAEITPSKERLLRSIIKSDLSIMEALSVLNKNSLGILLISDRDRILKGIVTDGDIRRGILAKRSLHGPISSVMNKNPISGHLNERTSRLRRRMWKHGLRHLPILDEVGKLVGLEVASDLRPKSDQPVAVIMAGGLGSRLQPLTNDCPKPLLEVGGKPILEHLIEELANQGFYRVIISVNYKSDMIENYFGDGDAWGLSIEYIRESKRLGTAGALALIEELPDSPIMVMNGDLITKANLQAMVRFHNDNNTDATIAVTEMKYQVPYGVVKVSDQRLVEFEEKPEQHFFINAGIYTLEPKVISQIPKGVFFDMPDLLKLLKDTGGVSVFPIHEYWIDIGQMTSYQKAQHDILNVLPGYEETISS